MSKTGLFEPVKHGLNTHEGWARGPFRTAHPIDVEGGFGEMVVAAFVVSAGEYDFVHALALEHLAYAAEVAVDLARSVDAIAGD